MSEKSVVLLSSGLDSTVNFWLEAQKGRAVLALTFDYGQRAAPREIERARAIAEAGPCEAVVHNERGRQLLRCVSQKNFGLRSKATV